MKILKITTSLICIALIGFYGCKKGENKIDANNKWVYLDSTNTANIKIIQVFRKIKPNN